jgi:heme o synthase
MNNKALKPFLKFTRFFLSLAISFSALAGFIAFHHSLNWQALYAFTGVLFMAASASALNQYQERHLDALMKRTQNRPIPTGQITLPMAMMIIIILGLSGTLLLFWGTTPMAAALGVFNMIWYNGFYTPLKRKTQYAVLVGAVTGSLPPMMGWAAAGGNIFSTEILFFAFFMFLWQIPHFWLLLLRFGKDYENAGFPSIASVINERQVKFIIFVWIVGTAVSTMFFPLCNLVFSPHLLVGLVSVNIPLIVFFYKNIFIKNVAFNLGGAFRSLYYYQVLILVLIIIQALR